MLYNYQNDDDGHILIFHGKGWTNMSRYFWPIGDPSSWSVHILLVIGYGMCLSLSDPLEGAGITFIRDNMCPYQAMSLLLDITVVLRIWIKVWELCNLWGFFDSSFSLIRQNNLNFFLFYLLTLSWHTCMNSKLERPSHETSASYEIMACLKYMHVMQSKNRKRASDFMNLPLYQPFLFIYIYYIVPVLY